MQIRRTVPFLSRSTAAHDQRVLLLDRAEIHDPTLSETFRRKLADNLTVGSAVLSDTEAAELVENQYESCLELVFSHSFWQRNRNAGNQSAMRGYLLETRHYLAAASFRMARGVPPTLNQHGIGDLLAHHVVEEADHNVYFENALAELQCDAATVSFCRPSPITLEWIHLMRTVASQDPLCAALCSGLLEHTAKNRQSVRDWHSMIASNTLVPDGVASAIFEHVRTDIELGHGANWRTALALEQPISARRLAACLNAVSLVAEMLVRWFDTIEEGLAHHAVEAMPDLTVDSDWLAQRLSYETNALPVWPADVLDHIAHGTEYSTNVDRTLAVAYMFSGRASGRNGTADIASAARDLQQKLDPGRGDDLVDTVTGWMTTINGHSLWREMTETPSYSLVCGWLLENYHYIAAIAQHTAAAIASCPDREIRAELVKHLAEELDHGALLAKALRDTRYGDVTQHRPLATTAVFVGVLRDLAQRDWKAYCVALGYLQLTITPDNGGALHNAFYDAVAHKAPGAQQLLDAMREHDDTDSDLAHTDDARRLLRMLATKHAVGDDVLASASLAAQFAWSFLDGIRCHYRHGDRAVIGRVGWRA